VNVVNVDPGELSEFLKTAEGEKLILEIMKKNSDAKDKDARGQIDTVVDDDDTPIDFSMKMSLLEEYLCDFEKSLDDEKSFTKHAERKKSFLGTYLRELADRLDGGVKTPAAGADLTVQTNTGKAFSNADEVKSYLKNLTDSMQPMLADLVGQKLAQMRGRLPD
jgi:hypothetical protein